ncbi:MAG: 3-deoxy-manno-octulosonate cytidylyltransferase [Gammaproteobacteria bacterium]|nr:3-deoxy-manno-octulosonate cytidylyltransferase [Gammaproteobacteria bacterium]
MNTRFHVVIPARYASTRLPGKPLLNIAGKPMIQHVYEAALASGAASVTVATDDRRIESAVQHAGGVAVMTGKDHASGSDRIAEACSVLGLADDEVVVNVQGDEPQMPPSLIRQVAELLVVREDAAMATLCTPFIGAGEFADSSAVKVVLGDADRAVYFSRAPVPWHCSRDSSDLSGEAWQHAFRHLGIYAYRSGYLRTFSGRGPCPLERRERLEQLRVLWHGECIACALAVEAPPAGVDTAEDLAGVRLRLEGNPES